MNKMHKSVLKNYTDDPRVQKFGIRCSVNTPSSIYPVHRHNYIEIEYIAEGKMEHELNGIKSILTKGSCYALNRGDLHGFTVLEPVKIHHISISYKHAPAIVQDLINKISFPFEGNIKKETLAQLDEYFFHIQECINSPSNHDFEKITAYTLLLLTTIIEHSSSISKTSVSAAYRYIEKAMEYVENNFSQPLTLKEVSDYVHLSPNYFSNLFKEISGTTFLKFLNEQRIKKAKELLIYTNKTILDIALECGFGSFSSFSRSFKKSCNCRPYEYRNKLVSENNE